MRRFLPIALLCLLSGAALAQDTATSEEDKGFLTRWLETNLSGAGREILIDGFRGALSSEASLDRMTIADDEGVWLTLEDVTLDWNRSALLRGRLDVTELSVASIDLVRWPDTGPSQPSPEATEFKLPELPVSVEIRKVAAESVTLGATILGVEAVVSLDGNLELIGGEGSADISIDRIDGTVGSLGLKGSYSNTTSVLDLGLTVKEEADGILVNLLDIPDRPSVDLTVNGTGPTSDFSADIALSTNSAPRVSGSVQVTAETDPEGTTANRFSVAMTGDVAPLVAEQYREFLGSSAELKVTGALLSDKRFEIEEFKLSSAALDISGTLALADDGLPEAFDVAGAITALDGEDVVLPVSGAETRIKSATFHALFQAGESDEWSVDANFLGLKQDMFQIEDGVLEASGLIQRVGAGEAEKRRVTANITTDLAGFAFVDDAVSAAAGDAVVATATLDWQDGDPVRIGSLDLTSGDLNINGSASIDGFDKNFRITGDIGASAASLDRFAALAGQPLAGAAEMRVQGWFEPLGSAFDGAIEGKTTNLRLSDSPYLELFEGDDTFRIVANRDTNGMTIDTFSLQTPGLSAELDGTIKTDASDLQASISLVNVASLLKGVEGPAQVKATARQTGPNWNFDVSGSGPGGTTISSTGTVTDAFAPEVRVTGNVAATVDALDSFAALAGQPLAGSADIRAQGWVEPLSQLFDGTVDGEATNLRVGNNPVMDLVAGDGTLNIAANRNADGLTIETLALKTPGLAAAVEGIVKTNASDLQGSVSLTNVGGLVEGINGPAQVSGTVRQTGPDWIVDVSGSGPGGATIASSGTVAAGFDTVDLTATGSIPIGLANNFMSSATTVQGTANFNLAIKGPPALNAVSGTISTANTRLSAPAFRVALRNIDASATLSNGTANIDLTGQFSSGGRVRVGGGLGLTGPYNTDLNIELLNAEFTDAPTYTTTANGSLSLKGPLLAGARIEGRIDLGDTEIRLAPTTTTQGIPDITHVNDRPAVEQTRQWAGLTPDADENGAPPAARPIGLDIVISAPSRIFIRGRGLDTELGGRLRITGTTANVIPIGQFSLVRGRLDILGKRLEMQEAQLLLQGSFDPRFRMVASTQTSNATVRIITSGTPEAPSIIFESDPDLPDDEILANLLFGRDIASISPLQAAQLAAAVATLAGSGGDGIIGNIRNQFNLDDLDVTTDDEGAAALRAGKYISENIYTDIEVTSEGRSEVNLNLDITPNITAKGTVGSDGDTGLGIFYERDY